MAAMRYDVSRSNVQINSIGTGMLLGANTASGTMQNTFAIIRQGNSARFANPSAVASWLASVDAYSPIGTVDVTLQALQFTKQDGINSVNVDVIADDANLTVATVTHTEYVKPGIITPTPGPRLQ